MYLILLRLRNIFDPQKLKCLSEDAKAHVCSPESDSRGGAAPLVGLLLALH